MTTEQQDKEYKTVPLKRFYPDDLETKYVNASAVRHEREHFVLYLFEVIPPLVEGGTAEERKAFLEKVEEIPAKCVGRFVLTPSVMAELVNHVTENFGNYMKQYVEYVDDGAEEVPNADL